MLVIEYKDTNKEELLKDISIMSEGLIWKIMNFYGANNFAPIQQETIVDDCKSLILLRTIDAFDESRKAKFSTFYTWRLKSHIRSKKEFFMRRKAVLSAKSLDTVLYEAWGETVRLEDVLNNFNFNVLSNIKKEMETIFNV